MSKVNFIYVFVEKGFCMRGDMCPYDHGNDPVIVDDVTLPNVLSFPPGELFTYKNLMINISVNKKQFIHYNHTVIQYSLK